MANEDIKKKLDELLSMDVKGLADAVSKDLSVGLITASHARLDEILRLNAWANVVSNLEQVKNTLIGKDKEYKEIADLFEVFIEGVERTKTLSLFNKGKY